MNWMDGFQETMERLSHAGAFLSVAGDAPNTMTIGWAWIGWCWKKPVFAVVVRPQRHTYGLIQRAGEFTVSVPTIHEMNRELAYAGRASGRDEDKFAGHGITAAPARHVGAPIIAECGLHYEMRTLLTQDMTGDRMDAAVIARCYPARDFHTIFFGEILDCYRTSGK